MQAESALLALAFFLLHLYCLKVYISQAHNTACWWYFHRKQFFCRKILSNVKVYWEKSTCGEVHPSPLYLVEVAIFGGWRIMGKKKPREWTVVSNWEHKMTVLRGLIGSTLMLVYSLLTFVCSVFCTHRCKPFQDVFYSFVQTVFCGLRVEGYGQITCSRPI